MTSRLRAAAPVSFGLVGCVLMALAVAGCAKTEVERGTMSESTAALPRPDLILVYDFAFSPDHVAPDSGIAARVTEALDDTPRTQQELEIGEKVAKALTARLIADIGKMGFAVQPGSDAVPPLEDTMIVRGQILSVDEGNPTQRVIIGFGAGRSKVEAHVQAIEYTVAGTKEAEQFTVIAESGRKPGMGPMAGIGAVTGHLLLSVGLGAISSAASETWGADVDADAGRLADKVSAELKQFFIRQGWIAAGS